MGHDRGEHVDRWQHRGPLGASETLPSIITYYTPSGAKPARCEQRAWSMQDAARIDRLNSASAAALINQGLLFHPEQISPVSSNSVSIYHRSSPAYGVQPEAFKVPVLVTTEITGPVLRLSNEPLDWPFGVVRHAQTRARVRALYRV